MKHTLAYFDTETGKLLFILQCHRLYFVVSIATYAESVLRKDDSLLHIQIYSHLIDFLTFSFRTPTFPHRQDDYCVQSQQPRDPRREGVRRRASC